jgi:hypothetical protein
MKLYFKRAELLLHQVDGKYVLEMDGKIMETFAHQTRAIAEYNRIRRELEKTLPPTEISDADRAATLEHYLAENIRYRAKLFHQMRPPKTLQRKEQGCD